MRQSYNGASVSYAYDNLERVTGISYNGSSTPTYVYSYTGEGSLGRVRDNGSGLNYSYEYDGLGRHIREEEKYASYAVKEYTAAYDTADRI